MTEPFLGQLALVPYNFAPVGWALCNGQLLAINQNQALFALLGTNYGGDGKTNFALPDLRGRVPISSGQGPGLDMYALGQKGGTERVTTSAKPSPIDTRGMGAVAAVAASSQSQDNHQPYLTLNWIIALQGAFPSHP
jgi:microcystin-dependent protein